MLNVRVYGIYVLNNKILICDEKRGDFEMTKFPGGGLNFGEGTIQALQREFNEELNETISIKKHLYTTDFFVQSSFNKKEQVISIYYQIDFENSIDHKLSDSPKNYIKTIDGLQCFRFININELNVNEFTFPVDKHIAQLIIDRLLIF